VSTFHVISELVVGALKIIQVRHEILQRWGSYQLMAVIFVPILQTELSNRAVTVIMDITSSRVLRKGRGLELKTGALKASCGVVSKIN